MAISASLIAKGLAGLAAIGAPVATGVYYKDNIYGLFVSKEEDSQNPSVENDPKTIITQLGISGKEVTKSGDNSYSELDLTSDNLRQLKLFDTAGGNTVTGLDSGNVKLKIEPNSNEFFPKGFKFTLTSNKDSDVTIKKTVSGTEQSITLKKDKGIEFKLKVENDGNNYSLEELLSEEDMKNNLKLNCGSDGSCTIQEGQKINVKDGDKKSEDVEFKTGQTNAKIKFEKYKKDYQNYFRFYVENDIELSKTGADSIDPGKLLKENTSYEAIKESDGKWFLSKK